MAEPLICMGIDPGTRNMGICVYDAEKEVVLDARLLHHDDSLSCRSTAAAIVRMREDLAPGGHLHGLLTEYSVTRVFVEDQSHTGNLDQMALQNALQALLGPDRCFVVGSAAIKSRFARYFPRISPAKAAAVMDPVAAQRRANKANAVASARQFFPSFLLEDLEAKRQRHGAKTHRLHDIADAFWIARYGAEKAMEVERGRVYAGYSSRAAMAANARMAASVAAAAGVKIKREKQPRTISRPKIDKTKS